MVSRMSGLASSVKLRRRRHGRRCAFVALVLCSALPLLAQTVDHTTGTFQGCSPEGKRKSTHGFFDPTLNELKNRDVAPDSYATRALSDIIANEPASVVSMGAHARSTWTSEALAAVRDWEATGASVEGRLIAIVTQGPEACNCHSPNDVDMHMWIATQPSKAAKPLESMIVEISPRTPSLQAAHDKLVQLANTGTLVRIGGWMLWDEEHGSNVGKSRGTLWEIHPIHKIEVHTASGWKDISDVH